MLIKLSNSSKIGLLPLKFGFFLRCRALILLAVVPQFSYASVTVIHLAEGRHVKLSSHENLQIIEHRMDETQSSQLVKKRLDQLCKILGFPFGADGSEDDSSYLNVFLEGKIEKPMLNQKNQFIPHTTLKAIRCLDPQIKAPVDVCNGHQVHLLPSTERSSLESLDTTNQNLISGFLSLAGRQSLKSTSNEQFINQQKDGFEESSQLLNDIYHQAKITKSSEWAHNTIEQLTDILKMLHRQSSTLEKHLSENQEPYLVNELTQRLSRIETISGRIKEVLNSLPQVFLTNHNLIDNIKNNYEVQNAKKIILYWLAEASSQSKNLHPIVLENLKKHISPEDQLDTLEKLTLNSGDHPELLKPLYDHMNLPHYWTHLNRKTAEKRNALLSLSNFQLLSANKPSLDDQIKNLSFLPLPTSHPLQGDENDESDRASRISTLIQEASLPVPHKTRKKILKLARNMKSKTNENLILIALAKTGSFDPEDFPSLLEGIPSEEDKNILCAEALPLISTYPTLGRSIFNQLKSIHPNNFLNFNTLEALSLKIRSTDHALQNDIYHYAKNLRLNSDELKEMENQLKLSVFKALAINPHPLFQKDLLEHLLKIKTHHDLTSTELKAEALGMLAAQSQFDPALESRFFKLAEKEAEFKEQILVGLAKANFNRPIILKKVFSDKITPGGIISLLKDLVLLTTLSPETKLVFEKEIIGFSESSDQLKATLLLETIFKTE